MRIKLTIGNNEKSEDYERVFVLSDIHNHYKSYCKMRDMLNWRVDDLVISDGDIVDRGGDDADPLGLLNDRKIENTM